MNVTWTMHARLNAHPCSLVSSREKSSPNRENGRSQIFRALDGGSGKLCSPRVWEENNARKLLFVWEKYAYGHSPASIGRTPRLHYVDQPSEPIDHSWHESIWIFEFESKLVEEQEEALPRVRTRPLAVIFRSSIMWNMRREREKKGKKSGLQCRALKNLTALPNSVF